MLSTRRRALLRTVTGVVLAAPALAACDLLDFEPDPPPPPDPLADFHSQTVRLAARYDAALATAGARQSILTAIRDAHRAHTAALAAIMRPPPPASPSAGPSVTPSESAAPAGLREVEHTAWLRAVETCVGAPAERALLLGDIAAARACHLEALK